MILKWGKKIEDIKRKRNIKTEIKVKEKKKEDLAADPLKAVTIRC